MKNRKGIIGLFLLIIVVLIIIIYFLFRNNSGNAFSVSEKKWIQSNKSQVIDIAVLNDLPYFGVDGEGIFFEFINDLEKTTGLKFNMISYNIGEKPLTTDYVFDIKAKTNIEDLSFFTDYYAVIGNNTIFDISELQNKKVGILKNDINLGSYYLDDITLTSYDDTNSIFQAYKDGAVDYIVVPYLPNIKTIAANNYSVSYRLIDMANNYIIVADGKEVKLNSIIKKYFNVWMKDSFTTNYKEAFTNLYFTDKKIDDQTKSSLLSKKYTYGYVANLPYGKMVNGDFLGINSEYLENFAALTGVEFVYRKYTSMTDLERAINNGEVDLAFGYFAANADKVRSTSPVYESEYVVLTHVGNKLTIDSLKTLDDSEVMTIGNSLLRSYVRAESKAKIKSYNTIDNLIGGLGKKSIAIIDKKTYDYYKESQFEKYNVIYESSLPSDYGFLVANITSDKVFGDIFSYYINTVDKNSALVLGYNDVIKANADTAIVNLIIKYMMYVSIAGMVLLYVLFMVFKKKKVKKQIKKEDKLKFVDMLTSLKNRNYLNYNMDKWDSNNIYPQTIIIVDLNNVQYINDNFGHEEGDNVIVSAANILINNQLENSDIIRTDGNEFLVYVVGLKEEDVIAYIRKLNKEFKGLTHGFGAALGYSIIKDDITTIDDAINEATLDMRTNKENSQE